MSKKRVYAAIEIADQEIRLIVLEIFEARYNVLRTERVACSGVDKNQKIVDESAIVTAIRQAITNAQAALGYRIERVLLAVPSVNVMRSSQKVRVQIEDGTKNIRLFHIQQGYKNAIQKRLNEDVEFVNANKVTYEVTDSMGETTSKSIIVTVEGNNSIINYELFVKIGGVLIIILLIGSVASIVVTRKKQ